VRDRFWKLDDILLSQIPSKTASKNDYFLVLSGKPYSQSFNVLDELAERERLCHGTLAMATKVKGKNAVGIAQWRICLEIGGVVPLEL
jgi:hypothetical protein